MGDEDKAVWPECGSTKAASAAAQDVCRMDAYPSLIRQVL